MFKLGDRVRCIKGTRWYGDVGASIGTIVAIPYSRYDALRVMYRYEDFLNDDYDYNRLHDCSSAVEDFQFLGSYFEVDEYEDDFVCLKEDYNGYQIEREHLELVPNKKGNSSLFR